MNNLNRKTVCLQYRQVISYVLTNGLQFLMLHRLFFYAEKTLNHQTV